MVSAALVCLMPMPPAAFHSSMFFDQSSMIHALNQSQVIFWDWTYNGSSQNWDEALLEVTFTAACTFGRI